MSENYRSLKKKLSEMFENAGVEELADIDWIICEVTGKKRSMLPFAGDFLDEETDKILELASLRLKHIPLAYILHKSNFFGRDFKVSNDTLIPRLDTEIVVQKAIELIKLKNKAKVLDIGTGSGAIAITISLETGAEVCAVDISEKALEVARENAKNLGADVEFLKSDLFENIKPQKFDVIVSNPPYIESEVIKTLSDEVKENEPIIALDGGNDGLKFYRKIAEKVSDFLNENGWLVLEIGFNQAKPVCEILKDKFCEIKIFKDFGDNDRVIVAKKKVKDD